MPEIQLGAHSIQYHGTKLARIHMQDWLILVLLGVIDGLLNYVEPFHRYIGKDMMTDLKFPFKEDTVPMWAVPIFSILLPCVIFLIYYIYRKDICDLHDAILGLLYSSLVTGVITDSIKDAVGRPRPNFYLRCFPDGQAKFSSNGDVACDGLKKVIKEGYKSFPSGHTSWSFAGLGFLAWYLCGKIKVFDRRGHAAKLCIVVLPYLSAALIGVSRVDDYWHHWTDVFTGALIGTVISAVCYLLFFPFPNEVNGWAPHAYFRMLEELEGQATPARMESAYVQCARDNVTDSCSSGGVTPALEAMENGLRSKT
ncbi:hypothetical protein LguiA_027885 [Lonicera macranthoides]